LNGTGHAWLDLLLAVVGSGVGSFGLGVYVGYRWAKRRRAPVGRHVGEVGEKRVIRREDAPPMDEWD